MEYHQPSTTWSAVKQVIVVLFGEGAASVLLEIGDLGAGELQQGEDYGDAIVGVNGNFTEFQRVCGMLGGGHCVKSVEKQV